MREGSEDGTALRVVNATVRFGEGRLALDAVDLAVSAHEVVCVLGPSGSGKSTLLRAVAGLQPLDAGSVWLGGEDQRDVPVHRRGVGLMFQDHQLFPQRDVAGNVAFGLRMRRVPASVRKARVAELLALVGLAEAGRRGVGSLSGGEQQRVALARALAPRPSLLMLDEPFGQLDRALRERLVQELRELFTALGTTVLAVTHDQGEAFALADRVVIMRDGAVTQSGAPLDVWRRPADSFVARFLGFGNLVPASVTGQVAETPWGRLSLAEGVVAPPGQHTVLVRPGGVRLVAEADGLPCEVVARTFHGTHVALRLRPRDAPEIEATCALHEAPARGDHVGVAFDAQDVVVLG
ncbi:ABC transporter ATP-binding protein [Streptomyces sp. SPB074]|uniref:ABC transporter ATP-binding protein n=1 Tax=Streptomyces sp. (strain SPB074) TaxID=465543 RepID=UPI00017FEC39|nr:ABC transporter ATP-binding protein [Streptomyces sp. SPB074]EDY44302.1 spermidine/putrescine ABC transporter, ATP-binding component [Streptomyces sp. SPB074]